MLEMISEKKLRLFASSGSSKTAIYTVHGIHTIDVIK